MLQNPAIVLNDPMGQKIPPDSSKLPLALSSLVRVLLYETAWNPRPFQLPATVPNLSVC